MKYTQHSNPFKNLKSDIPASIVVFLVAMPLCLGIALASEAPLFSGLIAGMIGGIVVGVISKAPLGVSGPAAGLAVIVATAIKDLGSFEIFLVAVVIAGIIQIILGLVKGGVIGYYFPSSVILGMLSGIGILIFMKQIPHSVGYDRDPEGDYAFNQVDGENTFSELINMLDYISPTAILISVISLAILLIWETSWMKSKKFSTLFPGPLVAVFAGVSIAWFASDTGYALLTSQTVQIPEASSLSGFLNNFTFPDFSALGNKDVYITAVLIAVVASLETLLSVEAIDKLDPYKRTTPTNRELLAQGVGNSLSGLIGGLPVTQVIVRSSANVQNGGKSKASAIIHGFLILFSIMLIPTIINLIPYASLAAVLFVVGYKLAKPQLFKKMWNQGMEQFIPFIATILGILFTDLLVGLGIGLAVSIISLLYNNARLPYRISENQLSDKKKVKIQLAQEVTFLNKARILRTLNRISSDAEVTIDASETTYMHKDVQEILEDFKISAQERNIKVVFLDLYRHLESNPRDRLNIRYDNLDDDSKTKIEFGQEK